MVICSRPKNCQASNIALGEGLDRITGSIETGKSADLIVVDCSLLEVEVPQISRTKALETWFEGRLFHQQ